MREYKTSLTKSLIPQQPYTLRNGNIEFKWPSGKLIEDKPINYMDIYNGNPTTTTESENRQRTFC